MAEHHILVIDDNATNLRLMQFLMRSSGFAVTTALSAAEALQTLEERIPDVALVDVQMPEMDGLELTRRLRSSPRTRDILIVAVSALAMPGDREKALEAGCDDYVTKPLDTRTFPIRVSEMLAERAPAGPGS